MGAGLGVGMILGSILGCTFGFGGSGMGSGSTTVLTEGSGVFGASIWMVKTSGGASLTSIRILGMYSTANKCKHIEIATAHVKV